MATRHERDARRPAVSFRLRRLEYLIPALLAALTAWTAIAMTPTAESAWGVALAALMLAGWSHRFPARVADVLLLRAALLLLGALLLLLAPDTAGVTGPYAFWLLVIAVGYALLLDAARAMAVLGAAWGLFVLAIWLSPPVREWRDALILAGHLMALPAAALVFARSMQRSEAEAEARLTDGQTGLYNAAGLFAHGAELFASCRRDKRAISLALLQFRDFKDVGRILGRTAARTIFVNTVGMLARATHGQAIAARTGREEFALLLPGMTPEQAKALLEGRLGRPHHVSLEVRGRRVTVMLDAAVLSARERSPTLEALYDQVRQRLARKRAQLSAGPGLAAMAPADTDRAALLDSDNAPLSRLEVNPTLPMTLEPANAPSATAGRTPQPRG